MIKIGTVYSDPDGIWKVTALHEDTAEIVNIQKENLNYGFESEVPIEEVEYFLENPASPI